MNHRTFFAWVASAAALSATLAGCGSSFETGSDRASGTQAGAGGTAASGGVAGTGGVAGSTFTGGSTSTSSGGTTVVGTGGTFGTGGATTITSGGTTGTGGTSSTGGTTGTVIVCSPGATRACTCTDGTAGVESCVGMGTWEGVCNQCGTAPQGSACPTGYSCFSSGGLNVCAVTGSFGSPPTCTTNADCTALGVVCSLGGTGSTSGSCIRGCTP